jgi:hypothetical protein
MNNPMPTIAGMTPRSAKIASEIVILVSPKLVAYFAGST